MLSKGSVVPSFEATFIETKVVQETVFLVVFQLRRCCDGGSAISLILQFYLYYVTTCATNISTNVCK